MKTKARPKREQVTMMLDQDVREAIREQAYKDRVRMADILNNRLRESFRLPAEKITQSA